MRAVRRERRIGWEFRVDGVARTFDVQGRWSRTTARWCATRRSRLGIALLPDFIVGGALDSGALVPVLDAYAPSPITLNAVFPQHREGFVTLRTFIGFLAERLGDARRPRRAGGPGAVAGRFAGNRGAILRMICGEY